MTDKKSDLDKKSEVQKNAPVSKSKTRYPWENQPCPICRAAKKISRCEGHGGGNDSSEDEDNKADKNETAEPFNTLNQTFNFSIVVDNNRELTFKLECNPYHLLSEEQKNKLEIVNIVLKELEEFKKENDIFEDCKTVTRNEKGTILSLSVILPTTALNAEFNKRLTGKNLLPIQELEQKKHLPNQESKTTFSLTPLSKKFTNSTKQNEKEKKLEENNNIEERKKPSSIRPKGPRDKLKPKGWQ